MSAIVCGIEFCYAAETAFVFSDLAANRPAGDDHDVDVVFTTVDRLLPRAGAGLPERQMPHKARPTATVHTAVLGGNSLIGLVLVANGILCEHARNASSKPIFSFRSWHWPVVRRCASRRREYIGSFEWHRDGEPAHAQSLIHAPVRHDADDTRRVPARSGLRRLSKSESRLPSGRNQS